MYLPNVLVPVEDIETARKVLHLIQVLEDLEDVKAVHSNMELAEGLELEE
jgi:transcriptional/translational regulatory protein YebC/TACO1